MINVIFFLFFLLGYTLVICKLRIRAWLYHYRQIPNYLDTSMLLEQHGQKSIGLLPSVNLGMTSCVSFIIRVLPDATVSYSTFMEHN